MQLDSTIAAIVTGGASGLGAASARRLAKDGAKVSILDVNADAGRAIAEELGGHFEVCDVTDEAQVDAALAGARGAHGQERVLVNCAGVVIGKRIVRKDRETGAVSPHDVASFARTIAINLTGTFTMISRCAAGMVTLDPVGDDNERGVIVCTSSVAADDGQVGQVAYAASKGGVKAMTLPIARDLAKDGIRVVTVLPGLFETPMFDGLPDDAKASLAATVPFPSRLGRADEYADLVHHICENMMINGEAIRLDGGIRLAPR